MEELLKIAYKKFLNSKKDELFEHYKKEAEKEIDKLVDEFRAELIKEIQD